MNFDNQGLLEIQNGTLVIRSNINHTGSLQVFTDAIVEFTTGGAAVSHTLAASGRIGGTGEIRLTSGVVVFDSVIAPGLPGANESDLGILTIAPGFGRSSASVIEIRVGETGHDRIYTPGSEQLDGELQVNLITNNGPGGSLFAIVSADQGVTPAPSVRCQPTIRSYRHQGNGRCCMNRTVLSLPLVRTHCSATDSSSD